ncbi:SseB family protein [Actinomadura parmotrematis]|uniref:SseB family protein n=1 Tax=Actinomadura parmotrematis TaxID=2864039 RepID=A0ABS7G232_9ACTN|nr:SseB family protein [Actinomadura parmotrematis]MBW8486430.1 SseB family protein [Actinomadura parmotrematis]
MPGPDGTSPAGGQGVGPLADGLSSLGSGRASEGVDGLGTSGAGTGPLPSGTGPEPGAPAADERDVPGHTPGLPGQDSAGDVSGTSAAGPLPGGPPVADDEWSPVEGASAAQDASPAVLGAAAEVARKPEFQPANEVESGLLRAASTDDHDLFLQTLAGAEVLLPVPEEMDYTLRPGRPGFPWRTREVDGRTTVPVFTSPERLIEAARAAGTGAEFINLPFTSLLRYWPDPSWMLAVNSGSPAGGTILAEQLPGLAAWADQRAARRMADGFEPQNEVEQRLFDAARRRDTDAFFKVLLGAQVLVPAEPDTPWGIEPADPEFPWRPVTVHGRPAVQVFTSLKWMNDAIGSSRFVMPSFLEIAAAWPDARWTLMVNPGTPIDAAVPPEQVQALSGPPAAPAPAPAAPDPAANGAALAEAPPAPREREHESEAATAPVPVEDGPFEPGNRIDQELYEAALAGDSDAFLRVLLAANVLVPIPQDAPLEVTPVQREFRWDAALRDASSVRVFTSLVRLREVLPESRFVYADFRELIGSWPREEWTMLLNPGTKIGASLDGDQVGALSEWAVRVGLVQPRQDVPVPPLPPRPPAPAADDVPPAAAALDAPAAGQDGDGAAPDPYAGLPEPEGEPVAQPTIMQKVVPHGHVGWYLEQGYDRVGGFVHPTDDVAELQTPGQLYETLGLLYEDSPFAKDDDGVHVIRWPAYCPGLYRVPFGGPSEEDLAVWGEAGWVVERPPFTGTGFASGSAGSIREYKVDSVRLPYGAEMYHLGADRSERFVAMYDPDRLAWLRPEEPAGRAEGGRGTEAAQ